jgi:hypothetical protein
MATTHQEDQAKPGPPEDPPGEQAEHERVMQEAVEVAAAQAQETGGFGKPGKPMDRR